MNKRRLNEVAVVLEKINFLYRSIRKSNEPVKKVELALLKKYLLDMYDGILTLEMPEADSTSVEPPFINPLRTDDSNSSWNDSTTESDFQSHSDGNEEQDMPENDAQLQAMDWQLPEGSKTNYTHSNSETIETEVSHSTDDQTEEATYANETSYESDYSSSSREEEEENQTTQYTNHYTNGTDERTDNATYEPTVEQTDLTDGVGDHESSKTSVLDDLVRRESIASSGRMEDHPVLVEEDELPDEGETLALDMNDMLGKQNAGSRDTDSKRGTGEVKRFPINFNQRVSYINELFGGNERAYEEAIGDLSRSRGYIEALTYVNLNLRYDFSWKDNDPTVKDFLEMIKKQYLG